MKGYILILLTICIKVINAQTDSIASDDIDFSIITIKKPAFCIYSDAYTYVTPFAMAIPRLPDTTSFEGRWESYDYCRTSPKIIHPRTLRIKNAYFRVRLTRNNVNDKLCFTTYARWGEHNFRYYMRFRRPIVVNMGNLYPEMRCFRRYDWIVYDDISRREFRRMMHGKRWYDLRLEHYEGDEYYTMTLKGPENSSALNVYPFLNNKLISEERNRPDPDRLYRNYSKALDKQRKKFDSRIDRNLRALERTTNRNWYQMLSRHFSEEERAMTREEWIEYYQAIMLNEQNYITFAPLYRSLLTRYLNLNGYRALTIPVRNQTPANIFRLSGDSISSGIEQVIMINRISSQYYIQTRTPNFSKDIYQSDLTLNDDFVFVMILYDGTIALGNRVSRDSQTEEFIINIETYKPELLTIGAIAEILGL